MSYAGLTPTVTRLNSNDIVLENGTEIVYWGDPDTDGSFRIWKDGSSLKIQIRVGGVWTDRDEIT